MVAPTANGFRLADPAARPEPSSSTAAAVAWLGATSWTPCWLPFGRLVLCTLALLAITAFLATTRMLDFAEWVTTAGLALATLLGCAVAARGVATARQFLTWVGLWFLAAMSLVGLALWLAPVARASALMLVAGVALLLPFNRPVAMPLAWHLNRHR